MRRGLFLLAEFEYFVGQNNTPQLFLSKRYRYLSTLNVNLSSIYA
jgi:hypothetical protein